MGCSVRKDTWGEKNCIASPFWREYWVKKCQTVKRTQGQSTGRNQTLIPWTSCRYTLRWKCWEKQEQRWGHSFLIRLWRFSKQRDKQRGEVHHPGVGRHSYRGSLPFLQSRSQTRAQKDECSEGQQNFLPINTLLPCG